MLWAWICSTRRTPCRPRGFYALTSHDATGQDRFQALDRNWTVCDQSPPGGTTADPTTQIDFGAVKDDETRPGS